MAELLANPTFTLKAIEQDGVGFQVGMGDLERNGAVVAGINGAVDGSHTAARHRRLNAVRV